MRFWFNEIQLYDKQWLINYFPKIQFCSAFVSKSNTESLTDSYWEPDYKPNDDNKRKLDSMKDIKYQMKWGEGEEDWVLWRFGQKLLVQRKKKYIKCKENVFLKFKHCVRLHRNQFFTWNQSFFRFIWRILWKVRQKLWVNSRPLKQS